MIDVFDGCYNCSCHESHNKELSFSTYGNKLLLQASLRQKYVPLV